MTPGLARRSSGRGFTVVELIVTISIIGILAAIIAPRFVSRDTFASRGFFDQATETVRYAQKVSVASRAEVFVCISPNSVRAGLAPGCAAPLNNPATGAPLAVTAPAGVTLADAEFSFTAPTPTQVGGQPRMGGALVTVTIPRTSTVPGDPARRIVVERETGYVHN